MSQAHERGSVVLELGHVLENDEKQRAASHGKEFVVVLSSEDSCARNAARNRARRGRLFLSWL